MAAHESFLHPATPADQLRLAASKGHYQKVCELVYAGASYEPDIEGRTALHFGALNGFADVVKLLADEGCDIDAQDNHGYTALHRAAAQGHLEVIKVLLDEGCLVDKQDEVHGNAALHEASWNGYSKTLELLVKQRCNVLITNKAGFSALHLAAQNGHNQSARVLLYAGCNPDQKNNYGDTPLHTAARYGHAGCTRILISTRCNINEQNKNGDTALHIAAALKRRKIAKLVSESGVKLTIKNKQNETAIDVARRKEHAEIMDIIAAAPKSKKKNKKGKENKKDLNMSTDDLDKKEKKGFFFKKKSKDAAKEKAKEAAKYAQPQTTTASVSVSTLQDPPSSEGSSFNAKMHPGMLLQGFRQHVQRQQRSKRGDTRGQGTNTLSDRSAVQGVLTQYVPKPGTQLYRDLAGNVKQGPVGYTPVCNCGPHMKKIEQKVEADKANLYDHIDSTHRILSERMDGIETRTSQQIYAIDKYTKERLEAERKEREEYVNAQSMRERAETERALEIQEDCIRNELRTWLDLRQDGEDRRYAIDDIYHWGYGPSSMQRNLISSALHYEQGTSPPGKLYRSKSDDTLSVASSHPYRKYSKLKGNVVLEPKRKRRHRSSARGLTVRDRPQREGKSNNENQNHAESNGPEKPTSSTPNAENGEKERIESLQESFSKSLTCLDSEKQNDLSSPTPSGVPMMNGHAASPIGHHSKTDSGSNPDSGYGSKIYQLRHGKNSARSDNHNSSILTSNSSATEDSYHGILSLPSSDREQQFYENMSNQMEKWYEQKVQEIEKKAEERLKQEAQAMQSRIEALEAQVKAKEQQKKNTNDRQEANQNNTRPMSNGMVAETHFEAANKPLMNGNQQHQSQHRQNLHGPGPQHQQSMPQSKPHQQSSHPQQTHPHPHQQQPAQYQHHSQTHSQVNRPRNYPNQALPPQQQEAAAHNPYDPRPRTLAPNKLNQGSTGQQRNTQQNFSQSRQIVDMYAKPQNAPPANRQITQVPQNSLPGNRPNAQVPQNPPPTNTRQPPQVPQPPKKYSSPYLEYPIGTQV